MSNNDEANIYAELPPSLRKKLDPKHSNKKKDLTAGLKKPNVPSDTDDLRGLVPVVAHGSIASKLAHPRLPLENPAKESDRTKAEKEKKCAEREKRKIANRRRRSGRMLVQDMSAQQKRALRGRPLVRGQVSYELLEPLHRLWLGYISELLGLALRNAASAADIAAEASSSTVPPSTSPVEVIQSTKTVLSAADDGISIGTMQAWQSKLVKADFHGAKLEVIKAKHPSLVGLSGIVAQETEGTFRLVTRKNTIKVVPKANVTYEFYLPLAAQEPGTQRDLRFELHGSQLVFRSSERASKKFKPKGAKGLDF